MYSSLLLSLVSLGHLAQSAQVEYNDDRCVIETVYNTVIVTEGAPKPSKALNPHGPSYNEGSYGANGSYDYQGEIHSSPTIKISKKPHVTSRPSYGRASQAYNYDAKTRSKVAHFSWDPIHKTVSVYTMTASAGYGYNYYDYAEASSTSKAWSNSTSSSWSNSTSTTPTSSYSSEASSSTSESSNTSSFVSSALSSSSSSAPSSTSSGISSSTSSEISSTSSEISSTSSDISSSTSSDIASSTSSDIASSTSSDISSTSSSIFASPSPEVPICLGPESELSVCNLDTYTLCCAQCCIQYVDRPAQCC